MDTEPAFAVPFQGFQPVAGQRGEILERGGRFETIDLQSGGALDSREHLDTLPGSEIPGPLATVTGNHCRSCSESCATEYRSWFLWPTFSFQVCPGGVLNTYLTIRRTFLND